MIVRTMLAPVLIARCAARLGFAAGALAGVAGVISLCALSRACRRRQGA
ncbi:MAG: hypothetical protein RMK64_04275 [Rhodovarius sp.]|nr:hypothetical protein [Rhodovarius sp.]MCX7931660.1 hypothetical protein [Rhodovarius sp.]MDW8314166.1 hypothetical protein [Rhodovarius sp.]